MQSLLLCFESSSYFLLVTYFIELEVKAEGNKGIMGGIFGKAMDENLKKNQEFMLTSQRAQVFCILPVLIYQ